MKTGLELIIDERNRQITEEGFDNANDSTYKNGELEDYAKFLLTGNDYYFPIKWDTKWKDKRFKRSRKENLIKAAALIAAHLDIINNEEKENKN